MKITQAHEDILNSLKEKGVQILSSISEHPSTRRRVPALVKAGFIDIVAVPKKALKVRAEMKTRGRPPTKAYKITRTGGTLLRGLIKARA